MKTLQKLFALLLLLCAFSQVCGCLFVLQDRTYEKYFSSGLGKKMMEEKLAEVMNRLESAGVLTEEITVRRDEIESSYDNNTEDCYYEGGYSFEFSDPQLPAFGLSVFFRPYEAAEKSGEDGFRLTLYCGIPGVGSVEEIGFDFTPVAGLMNALLSLFATDITKEDVEACFDREYLVEYRKEHATASTDKESPSVCRFYDEYRLSSTTTLTISVQWEEGASSASESQNLYRIWLKICESPWKIEETTSKTKKHPEEIAK